MTNGQALRQQITFRLGWRFLTEPAQALLHFRVGISLARLLPLDDFGLSDEISANLVIAYPDRVRVGG